MLWIIAALFSASHAMEAIMRDVGGLLPVNNPLQENSSFYRVASYNARHFGEVNDPVKNCEIMGYDLGLLRGFAVVVHEFPIEMWKSPHYAMVKEVFARFGLFHYCEQFIDDGVHKHGTIVASRYGIGKCEVADLGHDELLIHSEVFYQNRPITVLGTHLERNDTRAEERVSQMNIVVDYITRNGLATNPVVPMMLTLDTTLPWTSDAIWTIRAGLPVEDTFQILDWTRPSYTAFEGVTRNYIFMSKNSRGMAIGTYVVQTELDSFACAVDLWKFPDQLKEIPRARKPVRLYFK